MNANSVKLSPPFERDQPRSNVFLKAWHSSCGLVTSIPARIGAVRRRYQAYRIRKAIESYSFEKHVLSKYYRPVVSATTMRMCLGQVDKNKFPFYAHSRDATPQFTAPVNYRGIRPMADPDNASRLEFYLPISSDYADEQNPRS